jgi:hypothetical protein
MIGVIQEKGHSQKGARKLKINDRWHFVGRVNCDGIETGMRVEYTTAPFGDGNKLSGLQTLRPLRDESGGVQTGSTITDGDILRSVSNIVGNAAAAGKIDYPGQIHAWVDAAYTAFMVVGKAQTPAVDSPAPKEPPRREPGQDDEPPPFDDEIPPW